MSFDPAREFDASVGVDDLAHLTPEQAAEFFENYTPSAEEIAAAQEFIRNKETADALDDSPFISDTDRLDAINACREDLDFLAMFLLTEIYQYGYPPLFKAIWQMLQQAALLEKGKPKYAIGIPRGFSKTVVLKLYVVWLILFSKRRFILVVCNTATHAVNFLADVAAMLDHQNIRSIFGDWRALTKKDTQDFKVFEFRGRAITLAGLGSGSSVRGLNLNLVRPDIVIMDDMQSKDEAANSEVARENLTWMLGTLMKACDPQRCVFIFVGNMYPYEGSILRKLKQTSAWTSFITAAITADGQSIWPEHRSIESLIEEYNNDKEMGHPEIFFAEVMNDDEAGTVSGIDIRAIKSWPKHLDSVLPQAGFVIIDPSLSRKKSDDVGIGAVVVFDGIPVLREVVSKKLNPLDTCKTATLMAMKYGIKLVVVEDVAYQATLAFWMERVWEELGIAGMETGFVSPEGLAKNARIRSALYDLVKHNIILHESVRNQVVYQITQWNPTKTNNKDELLDILAYIYQVISRYPDSIPLLLDVTQSDILPESAHTAELNLPF